MKHPLKDILMPATIEKPKTRRAMAKPQPKASRVDVKAAYEDIMKRYPKTMAHLAK